MREPEGKLFSYRECFGGAIFREPRKGMSERAGYVAACLGIFVGLGGILMGIFSVSNGMPEIVVGVGFILMFSGDLLPKDRTRLAGYLRTGASAACFAVFALLVVSWAA